MLLAIKESIKYLTDGFLIVLIFSLFFASIGVTLFRKLFNYRCMDDEYGFFESQAV